MGMTMLKMETNSRVGAWSSIHLVCTLGFTCVVSALIIQQMIEYFGKRFQTAKDRLNKEEELGCRLRLHLG
jgi:hypothetical protein